jgi:hypothetical protein
MEPSSRSRSFKMPPLENSQNARRMRRLEEQKQVCFVFLKLALLTRFSQSRAMKIESARNVDIFAGLSLNEAAMDEDHPTTDRKRRPSKWAVSISFLLSHQI